MNLQDPIETEQGTVYRYGLTMEHWSQRFAEPACAIVEGCVRELLQFQYTPAIDGSTSSRSPTEPSPASARSTSEAVGGRGAVHNSSNASARRGQMSDWQSVKELMTAESGGETTSSCGITRPAASRRPSENRDSPGDLIARSAGNRSAPSVPANARS